MYELNINHTPKELLNKEFKIDAKGYRPQEVDEYLDSVISDYTEFIRFIKNIEKDNKDLLEENNRLKNENRKLKMELDTAESEADSGKFATNNVDILRRISNLEKIVYGSNNSNNRRN